MIHLSPVAPVLPTQLLLVLAASAPPAALAAVKPKNQACATTLGMWEEGGEFFPTIPRIKYEVGGSPSPQLPAALTPHTPSEQTPRLAHQLCLCPGTPHAQGPGTTNPLAYRWYNASQAVTVGGETMSMEQW